MKKYLRSSLFLLLLTPSVQAAEPGSERPLTYADALRTALRQNPTLVQSRADLASAAGALVSAKGAFDPVMAAEWTSSYSKFETNMGYAAGFGWQESSRWQTTLSGFLPTGTSWSLDWANDQRESKADYEFGAATIEDRRRDADSTLTATVSQPILQGWRLAYNLQAVNTARRSLDSSRASEAAQRLDVISQVAKAYWNLQYQRSLLEISEQALVLADEERRIVETKVASGEMATLELSRVQAVAVQARSNLIDMDNALRSASDALSVLLGEPTGGLWATVSSPLEPLPMEVDVEKVLDVARRQNPSLTVYRVTLENAQENLSNSRHARLPQLDALGSYGMNGYEENLGEAISEMSGNTLPRWYIGARFSAPLGNRADRGNLDQASAQVERAQSALVSAEQVLDQQVRAQVRILASGLEKLRLAKANLGHAEATMASEKALQREGRVIQRDLLEAERALSDARAAVARARMDHALAIVELGKLQGRVEGVTGE